MPFLAFVDVSDALHLTLSHAWVFASAPRLTLGPQVAQQDSERAKYVVEKARQEKVRGRFY